MQTVGVFVRDCTLAPIQLDSKKKHFNPIYVSILKFERKEQKTNICNEPKCISTSLPDM